ncbi:MAG: hypothetical protein AB1585_07955, partial [Thermodesulfobacteriota bacterium]
PLSLQRRSRTGRDLARDLSVLWGIEGERVGYWGNNISKIDAKEVKLKEKWKFSVISIRCCFGYPKPFSQIRLYF